MYALYPGAKFKGEQRSKKNKYDVTVEIKVFFVGPLNLYSLLNIQQVNFDNSTLCGYLAITGLTDDMPVLTTFFEAEIIGKHFGFLTNKWVGQNRFYKSLDGC